MRQESPSNMHDHVEWLIHPEPEGHTRRLPGVLAGSGFSNNSTNMRLSKQLLCPAFSNFGKSQILFLHTNEVNSKNRFYKDVLQPISTSPNGINTCFFLNVVNGWTQFTIQPELSAIKRTGGKKYRVWRNHVGKSAFWKESQWPWCSQGSFTGFF